MHVHSLYFSPTGGTQRVIDLLAADLKAEDRIDLSRPDTDYSIYRFGPEDLCLIGVPSYGGRVPAVALERLRGMTANGTFAVIVAVYGNRAIDDTLLELQQELIARGFRVLAAIAAVAEHSIMRQYGAGRPDTQDKTELRQFARAIRQKLMDIGDEDACTVHVPGNVPYREYHGVPLKPKAGSSCTACGLCARECPVQAIPSDNPRATEESRCISCMRCISLCPQHARRLDEAMLLASSLRLKKACESRKENTLYL